MDFFSAPLWTPTLPAWQAFDQMLSTRRTHWPVQGLPQSEEYFASDHAGYLVGRRWISDAMLVRGTHMLRRANESTNHLAKDLCSKPQGLREDHRGKTGTRTVICPHDKSTLSCCAIMIVGA